MVMGQGRARGSLNVDLGELPDEPDALYALATQVNVACGGHAGDDASMQHAVARAIADRAEIAAHPSYPDVAGFGRRPLSMPADALRDSIAQQCRRLAAIADALGARVAIVKPHGALYHDVGTSEATARAFVDGVVEALGAASGLAFVLFDGGVAGSIARSIGARVVREGFADRGYGDDGKLLPRSMPGALLTTPDDAAAQAIRLVKTGSIDSICVHGDTPGAVAIARAVRAALDGIGFTSAPRAAEATR